MTTPLDKKAKPREGSEDSKDLFATYGEYNKTLRTWFVTFGLGAPALFLTNASLGEMLRASGNARIVIFSFLIGCTIQVVVALINKISAWYNYDSIGLSDDLSGKWRYKFSSWVSEQFWIDVVSDVATVLLFCLALWYLLDAFVPLST